MTTSVAAEEFRGARVSREAPLISLVIPTLSGFSAVRSAALNADVLRPLGYKILLELIVRCQLQRIIEVPYQFQDRFAGQSKANLGEGLRFLRRLLLLRSSISSSPFHLAWPGRRTAPSPVDEAPAAEVQ